MVTNAVIGAEDDGSEERWEGLLDEIRVANIARSDAWVGAQPESVAGTFPSVGATESQ